MRGVIIASDLSNLTADVRVRHQQYPTQVVNRGSARLLEAIGTGATTVKTNTVEGFGIGDTLVIDAGYPTEESFTVQSVDLLLTTITFTPAATKIHIRDTMIVGNREADKANPLFYDGTNFLELSTYGREDPSRPGFTHPDDQSMILEGIPMQQNGGSYSYAVKGAPVMLGFAGGNRHEISILGPSLVKDELDVGGRKYSTSGLELRVVPDDEAAIRNPRDSGAPLVSGTQTASEALDKLVGGEDLEIDFEVTGSAELLAKYTQFRWRVFLSHQSSFDTTTNAFTIGLYGDNAKFLAWSNSEIKDPAIGQLAAFVGGNKITVRARHLDNGNVRAMLKVHVQPVEPDANTDLKYSSNPYISHPVLDTNIVSSLNFDDIKNDPADLNSTYKDLSNPGNYVTPNADQPELAAGPDVAMTLTQRDATSFFNGRKPALVGFDFYRVHAEGVTYDFNAGRFARYIGYTIPQQTDMSMSERAWALSNFDTGSGFWSILQNADGDFVDVPVVKNGVPTGGTSTTTLNTTVLATSDSDPLTTSQVTFSSTPPSEADNSTNPPTSAAVGGWVAIQGIKLKKMGSRVAPHMGPIMLVIFT
jgi:hypothetical protein